MPTLFRPNPARTRDLSLWSRFTRYPRRAPLSALAFALFVFSACVQPSIESSVAPTAVLLSPTAPSPTQPRTPTITPVARPIRYALDQTTRSQQPALENVRLALRSAVLADDGLDLTIAFEHSGTSPITITGFIPARDARLIDASGQHYAPRPSTTDTDLQTISPPDGFAPGGAHVGVLRFPRPLGPPPYQFLMPAYEPIPFVLDQPEETVLVAPVPPGEYSLGTSLRSVEQALVPIGLEVRSVTVTTTTLRFDLAFVNLERQRYRVRGIDGMDAWLLGADGTQYRPLEVSHSLRASITPGEAWRPGGENTGTITFPRPPTLDVARFVFASYETLGITFDPNGSVAAQVASSPDAIRTPVPTIAPAATTFVELTRLLDVQARALLANDEEVYLSTFVSVAQEEGRALLRRREPVPLASFELAIAPDAVLHSADTQALRGVAVDVRYALRDVPGDSRFVGSLRYDFERDGTRWKVALVEPGTTPPFWQTGEVVLTTTEHFLLFGRPSQAQELAAFADEAEASYDRLHERGLPLEPRYVAYLAADDEDFTTLTGRSTGVVGVAFWQYELSGDAFAVLSRAFYLNAAAFADGAPDARRATITHELVHLALADQTRPFTPAWLKEGITVYFEDRDSTAVRRRLVESGTLDQLSLATLTPNGALLTHAEQADRIGYAYVYGGAAIEYLVQRFGETAVLDLYRSYTEVPADEVRAMMPSASIKDDNTVAADMSAARTDEVLGRLFGLSAAQLDAAVKRWLRDQA